MADKNGPDHNGPDNPGNSSEDAQYLDDLTSLQREPGSLARDARDEVDAERGGEGAERED